MIATEPVTDDPRFRWTTPSWETYTNATGAITITFSTGNIATNYYYCGPELVVVEDPREAKLRRAREASREAVERGRMQLRARRPEEPRQYRRPVSRGRVCSGASRYRVMPV